MVAKVSKRNIAKVGCRNLVIPLTCMVGSSHVGNDTEKISMALEQCQTFLGRPIVAQSSLEENEPVSASLFSETDR